MDGGEDLSPDRLQKPHVRNTEQQPQHSSPGQGVSRGPERVRPTGRGVQERPENLGVPLNSVSNSGPREVPCLSFLIFEMGRVILAFSLTQGIIILLTEIQGQRKIKDNIVKVELPFQSIPSI